MGSGKTGFIKSFTKPESVTTEEVERALHFLNTASDAEMISETLVFPGRSDIGQMID